MPARCVRAFFLILRRTCASNKHRSNYSKSTPSGESAQASTSGTVHTHAAETCIGNRQQETYVTIASKTPYPQDLTKDPLARRPRTTTPTTTTSVIIDTKTPYPQDLIKDATANTIDTIDTNNDYTIDDTATAHFLFLIPPHKPSAPTSRSSRGKR